jgi:cell division protein FtsB
MEQQTKNDNPKPILIGIIVLLLGVIGYLLMKSNKQEEVIKVKEEKIQTDSLAIDAKVKELDDLKLAYERIKQDREAMGLSNDSLNQEISKLNTYISQVKRGDQKKIKELDAMIAKMKADIDAKDQELATLRAENDTLKTNIVVLNKEKNIMSDTIVALNTKKTELQEKVEIASILRAENIRVVVINRKGKEVDKEEFKSKLVDKIRLEFNLGDNRVARKDKKKIYFRLVQPDASVLYDLATGGGFFTSAEGKEIPYTLKQDVEFDNSKQKMTFVYVKGSPYKIGNHTLEVYHEGNKIGETSLIIK